MDDDLNTILGQEEDFADIDDKDGQEDCNYEYYSDDYDVSKLSDSG